MALRCIKSLRKQDGDGHRSDPAGDRRDERGAIGCGREGNVPGVAWVVARVDHHAPGLIHSPRISSTRPAAATRMSASPTWAAKSSVCEWQ